MDTASLGLTAIEARHARADRASETTRLRQNRGGSGSQ